MAFTVHPQDSKCLHTAPDLQENQKSAAHHRTQPSQHPAPPKTHITGHHPHSTLLQTYVIGHSLYLNHLAITAISESLGSGNCSGLPQTRLHSAPMSTRHHSPHTSQQPVNCKLCMGPPVPARAPEKGILVQAPLKAEKGIIQRNTLGRHAILQPNHPHLPLWVPLTLGKLLLWSQLPPQLQEQSIGLSTNFISVNFCCQQISPRLHSHHPDGAPTSPDPLWGLHTSYPLFPLPSLYFSQASHHQGLIDRVLHKRYKNSNQGSENGRQGIVQNGASNATSKTFVIWASSIWVKYLLLHTQFSHHFGQAGIGMPCTHSISGSSPVFDHMVWMAALIHSICCYRSLSHVRLFATTRTVACQDPLSMGILQARILEWVALPSSRISSHPRDQTQASHISGRFFTI